MSTPVIAVFDSGKTNKKVLLFDENYSVVHEQTTRLPEITDEDGFPCEDVNALSKWVQDSLSTLLSSSSHDVRAINFTSYGASFVHVDASKKPVLPLYNYLKPFPEELKSKFFEQYGGQLQISLETASPVLDHLNSGLLLYRLKYEKLLTTIPGYSLHLPQYLSSLVTSRAYSDITSIGCHTMLWNFDANAYHNWVKEEGIDRRLAPIFPSDSVVNVDRNGKTISCGIGLHDSSSALIPYLATFHEPFVLISTGTWSISMNPFNEIPLTADELEQDCLCYLTYKGKPVKSSRLFAGHMHEEGVKKLNDHFNINNNYFQSLRFDATLAYNDMDFDTADLQLFHDYRTAYHALLSNIIRKQVISLNLVLSKNVKSIFVDGGFSKNDVYMKMLARAYPQLQVYAASVAQATALGAAMAIHPYWNRYQVPPDVIELVSF